VNSYSSFHTIEIGATPHLVGRFFVVFSFRDQDRNSRASGVPESFSFTNKERRYDSVKADVEDCGIKISTPILLIRRCV
jgi:hypothetical protein